MKKRLIIYFNYHPNGQADAACRFAVQQMAAVGQVFFVNNGPLQPESRQWAQGCCHTVLERENIGFDVGAYRDAVLQTGLDMLLQYDEVVLMNYTLAGPASHIKSGCFKGFIHLISHLKSIQRDTRPDISLHIFSLRTIKCRHLVQRLFHDALHCSPPSGMYRRNHFPLGIIAKHRETIGSRNAKTDLLQVANHRIHSFQLFQLFL